MKLNELIERGEEWLASQGCGIVINRSIRAVPDNGELPDVIGWNTIFSMLIKCIPTAEDFIGDSLMRYRIDPNLGMGDWRIFLCPPDVILPTQIPKNWGLIYAHPDKFELICGIPESSGWWNRPAFVANKNCETQLMYAALTKGKAFAPRCGNVNLHHQLI